MMRREFITTRQGCGPVDCLALFGGVGNGSETRPCVQMTWRLHVRADTIFESVRLCEAGDSMIDWRQTSMSGETATDRQDSYNAQTAHDDG
jgi:hypothetical protein